nr:glyoxalase I, glyoxalase/bleomycin resistance protein/dihydroxybiphenyl dioxygenase [Tanacetum cinerariifolium]
KLRWEDRLKMDMKELRLSEDMTFDRNTWRDKIRISRLVAFLAVRSLFFPLGKIEAVDSDGHLRSCPSDLGGIVRGRGNRSFGRLVGSRRIRVGSWNVGSLTRGDLNGHIGAAADGYAEVYRGFGFGDRNEEGCTVLEFVIAHDLVVANSFFKKRDAHLITFQSGGHNTQIDNLLVRRGDLKACKDCRAFLGEACSSQHTLIIMDVLLERLRHRKEATGRLRILWKNMNGEAVETFRATVFERLAVEDMCASNSDQIWNTLACVMKDAAKDSLGVASARTHSTYRESWWFCEEVQTKVATKQSRFKDELSWKKTKEQMKEEDSRALKRKVECSEDKVAKKQKLDEEEVVEVVTTAKLMTEVVTAAATITVVTAASAPTLTTALSVARRRKRDKGKGIMVHEPKPLKKKTQIEQDEAYARERQKNRWKKKTAEHLKRKVESFEDKAAKKQNFDEEIVPNDDDDVYTEATPLGLNVPVIDYEIYT